MTRSPALSLLITAALVHAPAPAVLAKGSAALVVGRRRTDVGRASPTRA